MGRPCHLHGDDTRTPERPGHVRSADSRLELPRLGPPVLAQTCGIYWEQPAGPALASHFQCLWLHRIPDRGLSHIAVVPDGCSDVIWSSAGLAIVGPDRVAAFPSLAAGETIIGARFRIGAAASWLRTPLHEIAGQTMALSLLWGRTADEMEARIREAPSASERMAVLAGALRDRLSVAEPAPPDIVSCVAHLRQDRPTSTEPIRSLVRETGTSERTLRRHCHEHLGYGAKTLDRILRLQRFLTACQNRPGHALAVLAVDAGYADQAHLTREARELTSFTPGEIQRQLAARFAGAQVETLRATY